VKDDVSCLDMPTRHSWIDSGTTAPSLLRRCEAEHVLRAATQKLHVSQPAVTRQIPDLEDELGVHLFEFVILTRALVRAPGPACYAVRARLER
jgi:Bacterial regulatory helix-turn-helix protein, lysR family